MERHGAPSRHVVIVGGGQAAKWLLHSLCEHTASGVASLRNIRITIVEQGSEFATGLAWSRRNVLNTHLASRSAPLMRSTYGAQQQEKFRRTVGLLGNLGIPVTLTSQEQAIDVRRTDNRRFDIELQSGRRMCADVIVLANGYGPRPWRGKTLDPDVFGDRPGVHYSPWPARSLQESVFEDTRAGRPMQKRVLILGTYLNSIDAALSLAHKAGVFVPDNDGRLHYNAPPGFNLCMASRSGQLPCVWGKEPETAHKPVWFTQERVRGLLEHSEQGAFISMDEALQLLSAELYRRDTIRAAPSKSSNAPSIRRRLQRLRKHLARQARAMTLRRNIASVMSTGKPFGRHEQMRICSWQAPIDGAIALWSESSVAFSAEDQLYFDHELRTMFFNYLLPMTLNSALQLEALMRAGRLNVLALGAGHQLSVDPDTGRGLRLCAANAPGGTYMDSFTDVIDATGAPSELRKQSCPLICSLYRCELIQPTLRPFKAAPSLANDPPATSDRIEFRGGRFYLVGGGIHANPATCEVIPRTHHDASYRGVDFSGIYAMGRNMMGHYVDAQSIWQVRHDALRIVVDLCRKLGDTRLGLPVNVNVAV